MQIIEIVNNCIHKVFFDPVDVYVAMTQGRELHCVKFADPINQTIEGKPVLAVIKAANEASERSVWTAQHHMNEKAKAQ